MQYGKRLFANANWGYITALVALDDNPYTRTDNKKCRKNVGQFL